ncbi:MAG: bifunctional hydroxymethylpyrimidine kinase/phosphomethylpyrimidine kinase [Bacteroidia bacterium]|nr:bifunctional hydroxymethylpyrimidine kinase/phosphomethylpyrimidine kinase [Bacteroidia bacterium]HQU99580.1 PfkB family carbohydrate kinase [Bacteroidia bacterium]
MNLLIVGTVAFDALETPFGKTDKIVGGAATYASLAASYFARKTGIVSVVGDDFPAAFIKELNQHGISTEGLQIKNGEKSFFWSGRYHNDMNTRDTLETQLNVLANFNPIVPESGKNADFLLLGNLMPQVQKQVLEQMITRPKMVVMDTMNFWMDTQWDALMEVIPMVDVLSINDEEARQMSKEYSLRKAAKKILQMGIKYLIIKKGEHGALLFNKAGEVFFAPALPLEEVFDPTGAGDTFAGGFIGYLARTGDVSFDNMKRAIIHGSAMASFTVEKFGTQRIINLEKREIDDRVKEFFKLVSFSIS